MTVWVRREDGALWGACDVCRTDDRLAGMGPIGLPAQTLVGLVDQYRLQHTHDGGAS